MYVRVSNEDGRRKHLLSKPVEMKSVTCASIMGMTQKDFPPNDLVELKVSKHTHTSVQFIYLTSCIKIKLLLSCLHLTFVKLISTT